MLTLSVSSSTTGSPSATVSPSFLSQFSTVASTTDSPSGGTTMSTAIRSSILPRLCGPSRIRNLGSGRAGDRRRNNSRLFRDVLVLHTLRRTRRIRAADIGQCDVRRKEGRQAQRHKAPRAHIRRFLLNPGDLLEGRV